METTTYLQLADTNEKCELHSPEMNVYKTPVEKIHTPPYDNYEEETRSNHQEFQTPIITEAHVALQNGLEYHQCQHGNKMRDVRSPIR